MTTTVIIAIDDEGMLGNASSEEISQIDVAESYDNYLTEYTKRIQKVYPDVQVETKIGPATYGVKVLSDELDAREIDDMTEYIGEIGAQVYEKGTFWAEKK